MSTVHVTTHPLIQHKLSIMRDKNTRPKDFRELLNELSMLMGFEVTHNLETKPVVIETPISLTKTQMLKSEEIAIVPILRAGLGMTDGLLKLIPFARVGHIGLYRDEVTRKPVEYYSKLPVITENTVVIVVDPMLATGGSSVAALTYLKEHGCKNIRLMCLVAAPLGISAVQSVHPDVDIYVASIDEGLNENCYIVPGLGDAGDRIFGTK